MTSPKLSCRLYILVYGLNLYYLAVDRLIWWPPVCGTAEALAYPNVKYGGMAS